MSRCVPVCALVSEAGWADRYSALSLCRGHSCVLGVTPAHTESSAPCPADQDCTQLQFVCLSVCHQVASSSLHQRLTLAARGVTGWKGLGKQAVSWKSLSAPYISPHPCLITWTSGCGLQRIGGSCSEVKEGTWPPRNQKSQHWILSVLRAQRDNCKVKHLFQSYRNQALIASKTEPRSKFRGCVDSNPSVVVTKKPVFSFSTCCASCWLGSLGGSKLGHGSGQRF